MDNFKKIGKKIVDFLGVFIPNITFLVIFLTFMVTIVSRYFFKTPVTWSYEVSVLGYMSVSYTHLTLPTILRV